jgi:hypothetical protein
MCFTGYCRYENYDGECRLLLGAPIPEDAHCRQGDDEALDKDLEYSEWLDILEGEDWPAGPAKEDSDAG